MSKASHALVSLSAAAGAAGAKGTETVTDPAVAAPTKVKLTRAKAIDLAVKLTAKATGAKPEDVRKHLGAVPGATVQLTNVTDQAQPTDLLSLETRRKNDLTKLAGIYLNDEKQRTCFVSLALGSDWDLAAAKKEALKMLASNNKPINVDVSNDSNLTSLRACMSDAIRLRAGCKIEKPHERAMKLKGLSLVDMGRQYLSAIGHPEAQYLGRSQVIALCNDRRQLRDQPDGARMIMLAESVGDFPGILKDAINKTLNQAYRDANPTWKKWARRATAPDFKTINRTNLSESPDLKSRDQGLGIQYVQLSDTNETYALVEYIAGIKLTRRAQINDDLDAFNRIPMLQGNAAARKEEDVAYTQLTSNPTMVVDGQALFSTAHKNIVASGSGAAPSVATLQVGYQKIRTQRGPAGAARLNLQPKFVFAPVALEASTLQLVNSTQLLAVISTTGAAPQTVGASNPYANRLEVITNPRFDDVSTVGWYLGAFYGDGQVDTVEVCFLEDEPEPVLKQETEFDTDDQKYAVRHTVASKVIDFRGLFFNYGS